jgi:hypothetical protein
MPNADKRRLSQALAVRGPHEDRIGDVLKDGHLYPAAGQSRVAVHAEIAPATGCARRRMIRATLLAAQEDWL